MGPKRQQLAEALRVHREHAGLSTSRLAEKLGWSQSKVSKLETGRTRPRPADVAAWCNALGVPVDRLNELIRLADEASVEARSWRAVYAAADGVAARQSAYRALDERAVRVAIFQPVIVPGQVQTPAYARRVFELFGASPDEAEQAAAARIERQSVLYNAGKRFDFLITEGALRLRVGSTDVLRAQYDRLSSVAGLSNVTLGIIPMDAPAVALPLNSFVLREFADGPPAVTVETLTAEISVTNDEDVDRYRDVLAKYQGVAVFGSAVDDVLRHLSGAVGVPVEKL